MTSNWIDFVPPLRDYPWRAEPVRSPKPRPVKTTGLRSSIVSTYLRLRAQITHRGHTAGARLR